MLPENQESNGNGTEQESQHTDDSNVGVQAPPNNSQQQQQQQQQYNSDPIKDLLLASTQAELNNLRSQHSQAAQNQQAGLPKPAKDMLFENPDQLIEHILDRKLKEILGPTIETTKQIQREREIDHWVLQAKAIPQYAQVLPQVEAEFRSMLAQVPQINGQIALAAINTAIGNYAIRNNFQFTPQQPPTNNSNNNQSNTPLNTPVAPANLPAHLRPSASRSGNAPVPKVTLTELQLRMARENNMTPEEYMEFMSMNPQDVINYKPQGAK